MANFVSDERFAQCKLRKGDRILVSILPEKFAVKGKFLKLKDNEIWEDGWEVLEVWAFLRKEEVLLKSRDYLHQRDASDI